MINKTSYKNQVIQQSNYLRRFSSINTSKSEPLSFYEPSFKGTPVKKLGVGGMTLLATLMSGCPSLSNKDIAQKFGSEFAQKLSATIIKQKSAITKDFNKSGVVAISAYKSDLTPQNINKIEEKALIECKERHSKAVIGKERDGDTTVFDGNGQVIGNFPDYKHITKNYSEIKAVLTNNMGDGGLLGYLIEAECYGKF